GGLGFDVDLARTGLASGGKALAAEGGSRFVVEVPPETSSKFESLFRGLPCVPLGIVTSDAARFGWKGDPLAEVSLRDLYSRWHEGLGLPG
ncbi:MAG: hypothetical protein L3K02_04450, partial [Thermoplasmata archaeon]|nr:hypothetical protein [Thermoplasmata archaeon]